MNEPTSLFYVTTPIYYVNDRPHIGHVYSTTIADVLARYHRLSGQETFMLTGVDEHAAKVVDAAAQRGLSPQTWADQNARVFQSTFSQFGFTHNDFVRTSQDRHKTKVSEYVSALLKTGDVYLGQYSGWYDAGQEEYVPEAKAQEYGFKSPINGKPLVRKSENNYFFRLSAYRQPLQEYFAKQPDFVIPEARKNEILNRIAEAQDVPVSRSGTGGWGIAMPGDPTQTIYVWIDALCNYLTFVDTPDRRKFWQSGGTHVLAKDILWFHAAIWPALLMALRKCPGYDWVCLPRQVYAHSFWISEGQKMSKSLGNFVDLEKLHHYVNTFTLDSLRYFLATQGPLGTTDSDFAEAKFIEVYNTDLANTLGNCFSRISNMTNRYFAGKLPEVSVTLPAAQAYAHDAEKAVAAYRQAMETLQLDQAANAALGLVRRIDSFIEETQPFKLAKDPAKLPEVGAILYQCAEAMRIASVMLWPLLPNKVEAMWQRLGLDYQSQMASANGLGKLADWSRWGQMTPGSTIAQGDPLFPRYAPPKVG